MAFADTFLHRANALIDEAIQHERARMEPGLMKKSEYKRSAGVIHGLKTAKELMETALTDTQKA